MVKIQCQVCNEIGYLQKLGKTYYRIRHYAGLDANTKKSKFTYHPQSKEYIESLHIDLSTKVNDKPIDHLTTDIDLKLNANESFNQIDSRASSSARIEHQPPKLGVVGSNPTSPATIPEIWLESLIFG